MKRKRANKYLNTLSGAWKIGRNVYRAYNRANKRQNTGPGRKQAKEIAGVTTQFDSKLYYKRRSQLKWKKRRWIRWKKKVNAVIDKGLATQSIVRNYPFNSTSSIDGQTTITYSMYPANGTGTFEDDIQAIFTTQYGGSAANNRDNYIRFKSAVMDVDFLNADGTNTIVLDVYTWMCIKDVPNDLGMSAGGLYAQCFQDMNVLGSVKLSPSIYGTTPFQNPMWCKYYKVLSKRKIVLSPGQTATHQLRDPKNRVIAGKRYDSMTHLAYITRGIMVVQYGLPSGAGTELSNTSDLNVAVAKTYAYSVQGQNELRTGII